jgi:serine/threonine protein kinase
VGSTQNPEKMPAYTVGARADILTWMPPFDELVRRLGLEKIDEFAYAGILGEGGQATVCAYKDAAGQKIAAKIVVAAEGSDAVKRLKAEAEALLKCKSLGDTIVAARSAVRQAGGLPVYYFLMDVARGKSLERRLRRTAPPWNWKEALRLVWRVTWALQPVHLSGLVHRDLHPGNIFVDDSKFKYDRQSGEGHPGVAILDLGVHFDSWNVLFGEEEETAHTFRPVGSVKYASPEALNDPSSVKSASDVWSLGVLFYVLLTNKHPFQAKTLRGLMEAKEDGSYETPSVQGADDSEVSFVQHLLSKLLAPNPENRLSIGRFTKVVSDVLYFDALKLQTSDPRVWEMWLKYRGDIWACPRCRQIVSLNGVMCAACGHMNDEPIHWSALARPSTST